MNDHRKTHALIRTGIVSVTLVLFVGAFIGIVVYATRDRNPIPVNLRPSMSFSPLVVPLDHPDLKTSDHSISRSEDGTQILTYKLVISDSVVTVSQYVQPPEFSEIPEYKERFLNNVVKQEEVVQTANGAIYLGTLAIDQNAQLGVMLEKGLIVLMRPDEPLESTDWRRLGESLQVQKID